VFELGQVAGFGTGTLPFASSIYFPLIGSQGIIGVFRVFPRTIRLLNPEEMRLLEASVNQIALAVDVDRMHENMHKSKLQLEATRVRNAIIQSLSQDLRAPLVAIIGSASTQIEMVKELKTEEVKKLGNDIYLEAEQLSRLINNLLQITTFEAEEVKLQKQLLSLKDLVTLVINTSTKKLGKRPVHIDVPDNLPLVPIDNTLIQEVLINLIDNAVKFTPPQTPIDISTALEKDKIVVSIRDHGPGIMPDEVDKLFEKFYRGRMLKEQRGLGLGLAICRYIVKAHGGKIWAENSRDGGAFFRFTIPLTKGN
jgi:two-component system sensor histidine kinase KdpD